MSFNMGYSLIIYLGQGLEKCTRDYFQGIFGCAAPAWLWHTNSAMATKAIDKKEEEHCCHCDQPNLTIRFLNDVHLDNPSLHTSGVTIYNGKWAEGNTNSVSSYCCVLLQWDLTQWRHRANKVLCHVAAPRLHWKSVADTLDVYFK